MCDQEHAQSCRDLRGASRLAIGATKVATDLVETMHRTIAGGPVVLGRPLEVPARVVTRLVYGSIRGSWASSATSRAGEGAQLGPIRTEARNALPAFQFIPTASSDAVGLAVRARF